MKPRRSGLEDEMAKTEPENSEKPPQSSLVGSIAPELEDYCGIALEDWKQALGKDVQQRFGPTPNDLKSTGEPGW